jgi:ornithine carrier protein
MVSKVFEHPFDLVKVRLQTQPTDRPPMFNGAVDCFRQTYVKEGVRGLFRGLSMPVVGATLENATLFLTYNYVQGQLRQLAGYAAPLSSSSIEQDAEHPLPMSYLAFAAACAGSAASVVLTPVELIKCKMQVQMVTREVEMLAAAAAAAASTGSTQRASVSSNGVAISGARSISSHAFRNLDGPLAILRNILRQDGFRGLWLGQTGTLLRETGGGVAWFSAFEWASRTMIETKRRKAPPGTTITKKDLSSLQLMGAGAMSGICYNVVLFPADSVKSTMQTEREWASGRASTGSTTQPYKGRGFMATLANIYKTRGIRGLYAGCGVTCLRSAPSSALIFLMYNKLEALADEWGI